MTLHGPSYTAGVAKLRPADQFNPTRQIPCIFFSGTTFPTVDSIGCCLSHKWYCTRLSSARQSRIRPSGQ